MAQFKFGGALEDDFLRVSNGAAVPDGIHFPTFRPMTRAFAENWKVEHPSTSLKHWWKEVFEGSNKTPKEVLQSSHHRPSTEIKVLDTLSARISSREVVKWGSKLLIGVEFSHIPQYWEWLEDILQHFRHMLTSTNILDAVYASMFCYERNTPYMQAFCEMWSSTTNTLLTSAGEVSISLWDLHHLSGLPINGSFYDEVVPFATELEGYDQNGSLYLPYSCKYSTSSDDRRAHILPVPMTSFATVNETFLWNDEVHEAFTILGIPEAHRKQTYLTAFLSCWLCAFVLPLKDLGFIRPGVFKPASSLASGRKISLAIPVLTSIYRGLNELSTSAAPGRRPGFFPAHYVYIWIAKYFRSHRMSTHKYAGAHMIRFQGPDAVIYSSSADAKSTIRSGRSINWLATCPNEPEDKRFVDDNQRLRRISDLIAMRSCYVTLRYDDSYVIESYNPHRFGRQFGFYQGLPGELEPQVDAITPERVFQLFQASTQLGTKSEFFIPSRPFSPQSRVTSAYATWWASVFPRTSSTSSSPSPLDAPVTRSQGKSKKRKDDSDHLGDELEACNDTFDPPLNQDLIDASHDPVIVSVVESMAIDGYGPSSFAPSSAKTPAFNIKGKLLATPLDEVHELDQELIEAFQYIRAKKIDSSIFEQYVRSYVEVASQLHAQRAKCEGKAPLGDLEKQLSMMESQLSKAKKAQLVKEIASLTEKEATLASLVSDSEHQFAECTKKVNDLKTSHTSLEQSVSAIKEAQSKLCEVEKIYDTRRDALKTLDWTP
uniref:Aminotransferase-like plant mobile domain-containing protein n=1 Tax=Chenopodium quinoa TaxID=63459 RepID=A0A803MDQ1_CHEQI